MSGPRIVIAGGSIAGLAAGLTLDRAGYDVTVFERAPGVMAPRGAGLVVQPGLQMLVRDTGAPALPVTYCTYRNYLSPNGGKGDRQYMPQEFTSWEAVHRTLLAAFPAERYVGGARVIESYPEARGVRVKVEDRPPIDADLLVAAEGAQSRTRARLLPNLGSAYAGYVAWRGSINEADAPEQLAQFFDDHFTFSDARSGGHGLAYFIPGANLETTRGHRRINWVWYVAVPAPDLPKVLLDRDGVQHHASLPRGKTSDRWVSWLHERARGELHPRFAELVQATPDPFLQTIVDVDPPQTVFGRTILLGDAAFVVRPHTAGGAGKAALEAIGLAAALGDAAPDIDQGLAVFQQGQLAHGRDLLNYGIQLGQGWVRARGAEV
jgi:2-polyprenyl-6-methoxyphenol hydroxylase-like FAD-dependent oxidoreductase